MRNDGALQMFFSNFLFFLIWPLAAHRLINITPNKMQLEIIKVFVTQCCFNVGPASKTVVNNKSTLDKDRVNQITQFVKNKNIFITFAIPAIN